VPWEGGLFLDYSLQTLVILPIALGLLGFIEPCTIGGHLVFLDTQKERPEAAKIKAVVIFLLTRSVVAGLFGALITFLGQGLISFQTGIWLVFGLIYLAIGVLFLTGKAGAIKHRIDLAPAAWKTAQNPFYLGLAFGFNIPACAAPILFGLLGLATTTGSVLVFQLTGSTVLVGAVTAILRFGWLFPQLIVGFLAQRSGSSMQYYRIGAFGRALCMAMLALVLFVGADWSRITLSIFVMVLWTAYAFISGIVAVPYNDIVARSVPSNLRSRLMATRFFGGGILALGVVAITDRFVGNMVFPMSYAAIFAMASLLMFLSSGVFSAMGEPEPQARTAKSGFFQYLRDGVETFKTDRKFALFTYAQWCGGAVLMAMPFYVVQASQSGVPLENIALLLGAQTIGALVSNPLWGWWGDRLGKVSLLKAIAFGRVFPPLAILVLGFGGYMQGNLMFFTFTILFFVSGALANGLTIAVIGFLMEISPDDRRPAYSGYFNAITAPAFLLPLLAGIVATYAGLQIIFLVSMLAAITQFFLLAWIELRI